jgi:hypothetical protein
MENRILERFATCARDAHLEYLIIGGFAASHWGTPRFTADIDFVVESKSFENVKKVMSELEYALEFYHSKGSFAHFSPIATGDFRIDFMIVDSASWKVLFDNKACADFGGGVEYPIVSALHLVSMKLHAARQPDRSEYLKDLSDIIEIMLAQNISFENLDKDGILKEYGSQSTIDELRRLLRARGVSL